MGVPSGANSPPPCASKLCSPVPQYEFPVACEQALLFGRARTRERGVEERRACNDLSKIFISTPETPGLCKAWKLSPQTCRRLEKWQPPVKFRQPRARIIILKFIDRFCNSIKAIFLITDVFFFFHGDIELQRVRSDENLILWFSFRLLLKSRPYCSRLRRREIPLAGKRRSGKQSW